MFFYYSFLCVFNVQVHMYTHACTCVHVCEEQKTACRVSRAHSTFCLRQGHLLTRISPRRLGVLSQSPCHVLLQMFYLLSSLPGPYYSLPNPVAPLSLTFTFKSILSVAAFFKYTFWVGIYVTHWMQVFCYHRLKNLE